MRLDLYWIPLGAGERRGQRAVRFCGSVFEALAAVIERRQRRRLFHTALVASSDRETVCVEMAPVPDGDSCGRGVVATGSVGIRQLGRFRVFRYEVRRWYGGTIPDLDDAVESPVLIAEDEMAINDVLNGLADVPTPVWGRDAFGVGEMWNSNSVIAWALARAGLEARAGVPPNEGRAPGWACGVAAAKRTGVDSAT